MLHGLTRAVKLLKVKSQQSTQLSYVLCKLGCSDSDLATSVTGHQHLTASPTHATTVKDKPHLLINSSPCMLLQNECNYVSFMLTTEVQPSLLSHNSQLFNSNWCRSLASKFTKTGR